MSGKDDPFGSGGKTVIKPNPGGAFRPDQPRPTPAPMPGPPPARIQPLPIPGATVISPNAGVGGVAQQRSGYGLPPAAPEPWMLGAGEAAKNAFFPEQRREAPAAAGPQDPARGRAQRARRRPASPPPIRSRRRPLPCSSCSGGCGF